MYQLDMPWYVPFKGHQDWIDVTSAYCRWGCRWTTAPEFLLWEKKTLDLRVSFNRSLLLQLSLSLSPSLVMASVRSCVYAPSRIRGSLQAVKMLSAVLAWAGSLTSVISSTQDEKPVFESKGQLDNRGRKER